VITVPPSEPNPYDFEPLWSQLARIIGRRITSGEFEPGASLPSLAELATRYSVSQVTIRRALMELGERGQVARDGATFYVPAALP
jgi:DNA-binding GntR family transcriptional regulator